MNSEALDFLRRHSGLSLSAQGVFSFHGEVVPNTRVQVLFHEGLEVRADGDVTLTVGSQWAFVSCDGVARFVDSVGVTSAGLFASLKGGGRARCESPALAYGPDERFYLWMDVAGPPALLMRSAHQQLAGLLKENSSGGLALPLAASELHVRTIARAPGPHEGVEGL
jgi:hypothetical protein